MGGLGFDEMFLILIISILIFGKDLPRVARKAGMYIRRARRYLLDIKEDIERQIPLDELDIQKDMKNALDLDDLDSPQKPLPYIPESDEKDEDSKPADEDSKPADGEPESEKPSGDDEIPEEWKEEIKEEESQDAKTPSQESKPPSP